MVGSLWMKAVAKTNKTPNKSTSCLKRFRIALGLKKPQPLYERFAEWSFLWTTATKKVKPQRTDKAKTIANIRQQIVRFDRIDPLKKQNDRIDREKQFRAYVHACVFLWLNKMDAHKEAESDKNEFLLDKEIENFQNKSKAFKDRFPEDYERQRDFAKKRAAENFKKENDAAEKGVAEGFKKVISALKDLQEEQGAFNIFPLEFVFWRTRPAKPQYITDVVKVPLFEILKMYENSDEFCYILRRLLFSYCNTGAIADFISQIRHLDGDILWLLEFMEKNSLPLLNYIAKSYPCETKADFKKINLEYMSVKHMDIDVLQAKDRLSKREKHFLLELYLKDIQTNLNYIQQIHNKRLFHIRSSIKPTEVELLHSMNAGVLKLIEGFSHINGESFGLQL
jgi:hypothetical protein